MAFTISLVRLSVCSSFISSKNEFLISTVMCLLIVNNVDPSSVISSSCCTKSDPAFSYQMVYCKLADNHGAKLSYASGHTDGV